MKGSLKWNAVYVHHSIVTTLTNILEFPRSIKLLVVIAVQTTMVETACALSLMTERELQPIYGPWRIYTKEEEDRMIMDSLARENERSREWEKRRSDRRAIDALERDIVNRNL